MDNNSSVEMENGLKMAYKVRSKKDTFGASAEPNRVNKAGKRKELTGKQKEKAKAKAKMAKKSKRKNK